MKEGNVRYVINDLQPKADQSIISQRFMKVRNNSTVLSASFTRRDRLNHHISSIHLFMKERKNQSMNFVINAFALQQKGI